MATVFDIERTLADCNASLFVWIDFLFSLLKPFFCRDHHFSRRTGEYPDEEDEDDDDYLPDEDEEEEEWQESSESE